MQALPPESVDFYTSGRASNEAAFLDALQARFGFSPPRWHGQGAIQTVEAMVSGEYRALISLGGNFAVPMSDRDHVFTVLSLFSEAALWEATLDKMGEV